MLLVVAGVAGEAAPCVGHEDDEGGEEALPVLYKHITNKHHRRQTSQVRFLYFFIRIFDFFRKS